MDIINKLKEIHEDLQINSWYHGGWRILFWVLIVAITFGILCLGWWISQMLWNLWIIGYFGLRPITFWEMAGLSLFAGWFLPKRINN